MDLQDFIKSVILEFIFLTVKYVPPSATNIPCGEEQFTLLTYLNYAILIMGTIVITNLMEVCKF